MTRVVRKLGDKVSAAIIALVIKHVNTVVEDCIFGRPSGLNGKVLRVFAPEI